MKLKGTHIKERIRARNISRFGRDIDKEAKLVKQYLKKNKVTVCESPAYKFEAYSGVPQPTRTSYTDEQKRSLSRVITITTGEY